MLLVGLCVVGAVAAGAAVTAWTGQPWLGALLGLAVALPAALWGTRRLTGPMNRVLRVLHDGVSSLLDSDFSVAIAETRSDELGRLVRAYNRIGEVLRRERQELNQRELLLDTVIQATPLALVLTNPDDVIIYANTSARELFLGGSALEGRRFAALLADAPEAMSAAVAAGHDGLFTVELEDGPETFHLSRKSFLLNTRPHHLYLFKHLTRELSRREVETWKKVIRVIGHELNNSLAPVSSLAHSGRKLVERQAAAPGDGSGELERVAGLFASIEERSRHLMDFIAGYSRFAKLPEPRKDTVPWEAFVERLRPLADFRLAGPLPQEPGWFDAAQLEQVLINLLKNAAESGSDPGEVELEVREEAGRHRVAVLDRGSGMSDTVMKSALLPFYSTKRTGSGLGLPLCREVVESHGGRLSLANRRGGGLAVSFWIPAPPEPAGTHRVGQKVGPEDAQTGI